MTQLTVGSITFSPVENFHQRNYEMYPQLLARNTALMAAVKGWADAEVMYLDITKQPTLADRVAALEVWREAKEHLRSFLT